MMKKLKRDAAEKAKALKFMKKISLKSSSRNIDNQK